MLDDQEKRVIFRNGEGGSESVILVIPMLSQHSRAVQNFNSLQITFIPGTTFTEGRVKEYTCHIYGSCVDHTAIPRHSFSDVGIYIQRSWISLMNDRSHFIQVMLHSRQVLCQTLQTSFIMSTHTGVNVSPLHAPSGFSPRPLIHQRIDIRLKAEPIQSSQEIYWYFQHPHYILVVLALKRCNFWLVMLALIIANVGGNQWIRRHSNIDTAGSK